ncbi:Thioredoxin [Carpediemonas membranifera]|uniref:Thioredoxin n=1 Tax=Carpediemonas membranifera TaxID=201153 RepID=A0A8J6AWD4_9EUKA|nr:Thioredoxin [Carpediemonas membranifera]|eukprot:KAG9393255.1 Thioredoxin [Carpediemonas membranifera]
MLSSLSQSFTFGRLLGVTPITTAQLKQKVTDGETMVVDYFATWCGPCKALKPTFHQLADDKKFEKVSFYTIDIDENYDAGVLSVPTVRSFHMGDQMDEMIGWQGPDRLEELVKQAM